MNRTLGALTRTVATAVAAGVLVLAQATPAAARITAPPTVAVPGSDAPLATQPQHAIVVPNADDGTVKATITFTPPSGAAFGATANVDHKQDEIVFDVPPINVNGTVNVTVQIENDDRFRLGDPIRYCDPNPCKATATTSYVLAVPPAAPRGNVEVEGPTATVHWTTGGEPDLEAVHIFRVGPDGGDGVQIASVKPTKKAHVDTPGIGTWTYRVVVERFGGAEDLPTLTASRVLDPVEITEGEEPDPQDPDGTPPTTNPGSSDETPTTVKPPKSLGTGGTKPSGVSPPKPKPISPGDGDYDEALPYDPILPDAEPADADEGDGYVYLTDDPVHTKPAPYIAGGLIFGNIAALLWSLNHMAKRMNKVEQQAIEDYFNDPERLWGPDAQDWFEWVPWEPDEL